MEKYPEAGFLFIVAPASLTAFVLATKVTFPSAGGPLKRTYLFASLGLSFLSVALTVLFTWPIGAGCQ